RDTKPRPTLWAGNRRRPRLGGPRGAILVTDDQSSGHPPSDGQMLQLAGQMPLLESAHADPAAQVEEIFRTHADFVWRSLRRQGVPDADIEDAVQEVFLVVYKRLGDYVEQGAVRAWLFTISRQVANHHRRSFARRERKHEALHHAPVAEFERMDG